MHFVLLAELTTATSLFESLYKSTWMSAGTLASSAIDSTQPLGIGWYLGLAGGLLVVAALIWLVVFKLLGPSKPESPESPESGKTDATPGAKGGAAALSGGAAAMRGGATAAGAASAAYSLGSLGKSGAKMRVPAWILAVTILLTMLAWPIWTWSSFHMAKARAGDVHADQSWSPGPISIAHASFAKDCQACHVNAFESVRDSSCAAYHKDVHDHAPANQLADAKGTPNPFRRVLNATSRLFNKPENSCVACHIEHEGAVSMPATPQRFCTDCHDGLSTRLKTTKLLDVGDFKAKHPEFRPGIVVAPGESPVIRRISLASAPRFFCIDGTATLTMVTSMRFMKLAMSSTASASQRRGSASALLRGG